MPAQLLLINFLTDGLPALGVDPTRKGTVQKKAEKKAEGIMNRKSIYRIMGIGIELALVSTNLSPRIGPVIMLD